MKTILISEKEQIKGIISSCDICFLGVNNKAEAPYVVPMNFGYDDGVFYLHSAPEGKLIDLINENNKVCLSFCTDTKLVAQHPEVACSYRMKSQSVIAWGEVEFIEDITEKENALHIIMAQYTNKKFTYSFPALKNVKIWKIPIEKVSCKSFAEPHK
jgi:nitroimidazol reductase NimA-like FMN-containing flavoprotein (pyridoxamine 5'-phosphate oxidase superfamily)